MHIQGFKAFSFNFKQMICMSTELSMSSCAALLTGGWLTASGHLITAIIGELQAPSPTCCLKKHLTQQHINSSCSQLLLLITASSIA
jgi:hypothetical protein